MPYTIDAVYVHMKDANVRVSQYADKSLALIAEGVDDEGFPDVETLSVNLTAYNLRPAPNCVYVKAYAEHEGLAEALVTAGIGVIEGTIHFGPYNTTAHVLRLNEEVL